MVLIWFNLEFGNEGLVKGNVCEHKEMAKRPVEDVEEVVRHLRHRLADLLNMAM